MAASQSHSFGQVGRRALRACGWLGGSAMRSSDCSRCSCLPACCPMALHPVPACLTALPLPPAHRHPPAAHGVPRWLCAGPGQTHRFATGLPSRCRTAACCCVPHGCCCRPLRAPALLHCTPGSSACYQPQATCNPVAYSLIPELFPNNRTAAMAVYNCAIYLGRAAAFGVVFLAGQQGLAMAGVSRGLRRRQSAAACCLRGCCTACVALRRWRVASQSSGTLLPGWLPPSNQPALPAG